MRRTLTGLVRMCLLEHLVFAGPLAALSAVTAAQMRQVGFVTTRRFAILATLEGVCLLMAWCVAQTFNRLIDRRYDDVNPRMASRPLQSGQVTPRQAWVFVGVCTGVYFIAAGAFWWVDGNYWPVLLAGPFLGWQCFYSYTKRFTATCHLVLGAGLGLSVIAAWVGISPGTVGPATWTLAAVSAAWVAGFDIIYALQDIPFDRAHRCRSIPAAVGPANALWISRALHLTSVTAMLWFAHFAQPFAGPVYLAGVAIAAIGLTVEQMLVSPTNLSRVNQAFFLCNGLVGALLGTLGVLDVANLL